MRVLYFLAIIGMLCCTNTPVFAKRKATTHRSVKTHHYAANTKRRKFTLPKVTAPVSIYGASQLINHINSIIYDNSMNADVAVYVKSMQHGDSLYSRNVNTSMTPASTMKLFTAEAALLYLGPEYRFSTQVLTDAKDVKNGVLLGNLYIVLSGDPTLTYNDLLELMLTMRSHQIKAIQGNVYIDNTAYDQRFYGPGWVWKDKDYCYAAPISASIINKNCISIQMSGKAPGKVAQVIKSPKYFYPTISNSVVTKNGRGTSIHLTTGQSSSIYLDGYLSKGRAWGVSYVISDIPEYNRSMFKSILARMLISVYGNVTFKSAPDNLAYIGTHSSKPLKSLINDMLKKSDNVIAGAVFKKLGQLYSRQPGSWENGSLAVSQILAKNAGVSSSGLRILDGSGLSPDNLATPTQMMKVLDFAFHHYPTSYEFVSALPIAGVDGTLKHRLGNVARKVRAKTGTISGVVSLAGYTQSADKEPLAFVIMVNGSKGMGWRYKEMEDQIVTALTRYRR